MQQPVNSTPSANPSTKITTPGIKKEIQNIKKENHSTPPILTLLPQ